jgi:hypothetical protein
MASTMQVRNHWKKGYPYYPKKTGKYNKCLGKEGTVY